MEVIRLCMNTSIKLPTHFKMWKNSLVTRRVTITNSVVEAAAVAPITVAATWMKASRRVKAITGSKFTDCIVEVYLNFQIKKIVKKQQMELEK